jgi:hypothetical protein
MLQRIFPHMQNNSGTCYLEAQVIELGFPPGTPGALGAALVEERDAVKLYVVSENTLLSWKLR